MRTVGLTDKRTNKLHAAERSLKSNGSSSSPEIPRILWNSEFNGSVYKNQPTVPILSQANPIHPLPNDL